MNIVYQPLWPILPTTLRVRPSWFMALYIRSSLVALSSQLYVCNISGDCQLNFTLGQLGGCIMGIGIWVAVTHLNSVLVNNLTEGSYVDRSRYRCMASADAYISAHPGADWYTSIPQAGLGNCRDGVKGVS